MFSAVRRSALSSVSNRAFSTTSARSHDVSKLVLVGRLGKEAEIRTTKNDKEYAIYKVATANYPRTPSDPNDPSSPSKTTWHTILAFNPSVASYLKTIPVGSQVYVEANYELREADPSADPDTPAGQRQIFLRHESIRLLKSSNRHSNSEEESQ
ncbi:hypothetical protein BDY19DRAFT_924520 [Irpex rosettiformis]|uniref:Uncharacterized protein n=1 Tax=Irpex rosettiformis TaxID=378272 RepID=A0ACB8UE06_9APHY|nr:hypothetical protein BDY19DRAFT_924520 [Irpex rosettiformis]